MIETYKKYIPLGVIFLLSISIYFIWLPILTPFKEQVVSVAFLDVGQGDAIFITSPSGRQILIDGGKDNTILRELGSVMPFWDRDIDMVIATHPDSDHIGGLVEVLERYSVATVVHSGVAHDTELVEVFENRRERANTVLEARRGQVFDMGDGLYIEVLFPDRDIENIESNTGSVIVKVIYGEHSFVLTGDSPQSIEKYLVGIDGASLDATVLKAGHHGSKTSSALIFVGTVSPEYVVYSRGCENRYGHPHDVVLDTIKTIGGESYDTCIDGRVTFYTNGSDISVVTRK